MVDYLDQFLDIAGVEDYPRASNGLQVQGRDEVHRIAVAVDACLATIAAAADGQADLLIVHHGLYWGMPEPLTGAAYGRFAGLIRSGVGLYSAHLPLDVHPTVGNNAELARRLDLPVVGAFGSSMGHSLGLIAEGSGDVAALAERTAATLGHPCRLVFSTGRPVGKIALVTGGAGGELRQAAAAGCDTYITGEGPHHSYLEAEELGVNLLYAGHYATETVGVQALAAHLSVELGLQTWFIDHPTGL